MSFVAPVKADDDREDDAQWPKKNVVGRQELEVRIDKDHISFETAKIGSLADVNDSEDAEGLRVFYYLVQDLKVSFWLPSANSSQCFVLSLITLHFKIKPSKYRCRGAERARRYRSAPDCNVWCARLCLREVP